MRVLVAPNAFKGSLSVTEAALAFARGLRLVLPKAEFDLMPIADGGDGLMDALIAAKGGKIRQAAVRGPLGRSFQAPWALLEDGSAVVEMARASGLALVSERRPLRASTEGTGDLIAAAARAGAKTISVGLGGTASSDGGAGMARALGWKLLDSRGREIAPGAAGLLELERAVAPPPLKAKVVGVSDVVNPLLGARGSARVYGPQKGASPAQVRLIERGLANLARVVAPGLARNRGAGAAGGCGFGLMAFLGAKLVPGADFVLDACGAKARLKGAAAVVTGEGRLDSTSFFGKAPVELARLAEKAGVPAIFVCGAIEPSARLRLKALGARAAVSLADAGASPVGSMKNAARWAAKATALAAKTAFLACVLLVPAAAADYAAIDALYFTRDEPGKLEESIVALKDASELDGLWRRCRSLIRRGQGLTEEKSQLLDYKAAISDCEKAVALSSGSVDAHWWLGVALGLVAQKKGPLKALGIAKQVRVEMETVLSLEPAHGGAYNVLAEIDWQLPGFVGGNKKRALERFEKALELSPTYSANYVALAKTYLKLGRIEDAKKILARLEALQRDKSSDPPQLKTHQAAGAALLAGIK